MVEDEENYHECECPEFCEHSSHYEQIACNKCGKLSGTQPFYWSDVTHEFLCLDCLNKKIEKERGI